MCPTCVNTRRPVCATDGVQDLNECHLRRQACEGDIKGVAVAVEEPCGIVIIQLVVMLIFSNIFTSLTVCVLKEVMRKITDHSKYFLSFVFDKRPCCHIEMSILICKQLLCSYIFKQERNVAPFWTLHL